MTDQPRLGERSVPGKRGTVVVYAPSSGGFAHRHECVTRAGLAGKLAALMGFEARGDCVGPPRYPGPVYFVPSDTLVGSTAASLGIASERDLFGGVVPHGFVATKAISHGLVEEDAVAPPGWSHAFGRRVRDAVLLGFTVFSHADARQAGERLFEHGPVRVKPVRATGGRGQSVAATSVELEEQVAAIDGEEIGADGLVLEQNLTDVTTYSVGQVRVAGLVVSYHGVQRLTPDNAGCCVYGGSDLVAVRGGFGALLGLGLPEDVRAAVERARVYDAAANELFPGFFASRRNYDVARGLDAAGAVRIGVLEQSWRMGGASGAEIAALEAFKLQPELAAVQASTFEVYGGATPPGHATVYFDDVDEHVGRLTKYTLVQAHADTRPTDRDPG